MPRASEDRLFARFRARREPAALAVVFDRLAPDLLRIAAHLMGRMADAEDVVQQTFLVAIERADTWDEAQGLYPWLVGILTNQARLRRRGAARTPDPARLPGHLDELPDAAAEHNELRAAVADTVARLGEVYRPVLHLHLFVGLNAKEIGDALGRPAGSVRTQLVRGLQQLRRALPIGLGVAAGALGAGRGLAAVRGQVLAAAEGQAAALGGAGVGFVLGGVVTMKKAVVVASVVAVAGLGAWMLGRDGAGWEQPDDGQRQSKVVQTHSRQIAGAAAAEPAADVGPLRRVVAPARGRMRVTVRGTIPSRVDPYTALALGGSGPVLAAAGVSAWRESGDGVAHDGRNARTGRDGTVVLADLAPGMWRVQAGVGARAHSGVASVAVPPEAVAECALDVDMAASLHGRVVDRSGLPVAGAEVWAGDGVLGQSSSPDGLLRCAAVTGDDGRFTLLCAAGEERVAARKPGYAASWSHPVAQLGDGEVLLVLGAGAASVVGSVTAEDGAAVAGVVIGLQLEGEVMHRAADGTLRAPHLPVLLCSDAEGRFAADDLMPGRYACRTRAPGRADTSTSFTVTAGGRADLSLRLAAAVTLTGSVRDRAGAPLADVFVWVTQSGPDGRTVTTKTGAGGRFAFERLPTRPFVVEASRRAGGSRASLAFPHATGTLACDLTLDERPGIRGSVRWPAGDAAIGCWVEAFAAARQSAGSTRTGDDGSFVLPDLGPGAFTIAVWAQGAARGESTCERTGVCAGDEPLKIVLPARPEPLASIAGRLVDVEGRPVGRAWIEIEVPDGSAERWPRQVEADGTFQIGPLDAGKHTVTVRAPGFLPCVHAHTLAVAETWALGDVVLHPEARLRVRFLRPDGTPWRERPPAPWLQAANGTWLLAGRGGVEYEVVGGAVVVSGVPPGRYRVQGEPEGELLIEPRDVLLAGGATAELEMTVRLGRRRSLVFATTANEERTLHVEVVSADGEVVDRADCRRGKARDYVHDHVYPPGRYTVVARTDDGARWRATFTVDAEWRADQVVAVARADG